MSGRTFAVGDIHGDISALFALLSRLPTLTEKDTLVFVGDYVDRGPASAQVIDSIRRLPRESKARIVALRGNHEDAWLRVIERGWPEFVLPRGNGCLAAMRSLHRRSPSPGRTRGRQDEELAMLTGAFFPPDVVEWMTALPFWYEDEHAIYVHAGLPRRPDGVPAPLQVKTEGRPPLVPRRGLLPRVPRQAGRLRPHGDRLPPPELSSYTPEDPADIWAGPLHRGPRHRVRQGGLPHRARAPGDARLRVAVKVTQETLTVATEGRGFHDVTAQVRAVVARSGVQTGLCTVFVQHTSASLLDPGERRSLGPPRPGALAREARPEDSSAYEHDAEGPDDMPGHLKASITRASESVPIASGRLALGTWQAI